MDTQNKYISPTKSQPVFTAVCDHFGYIYRTLYKDYCIKNSCGNTFATSYFNAIEELHLYILDNKWIIEEYPKCKFKIMALDGSWCEKHDRPAEVKVYEISAAKAKKYLI